MGDKMNVICNRSMEVGEKKTEKIRVVKYMSYAQYYDCSKKKTCKRISFVIFF